MKSLPGLMRLVTVAGVTVLVSMYITLISRKQQQEQ